MTTRTIALLAAGGVALLAVGFATGRRSETRADDKGAATSTSAPIPGPTAPLASPASAASAAPSASAATDNAGSTPLSDPAKAADLFSKLQVEKETRPKLEPTAETVFAALTSKVGVEVDEHLQVAGFVVGARYCDKIRTKKDVHVVVCEYPDEAAAIKGVALGTNQAIKGRQVLRNKTTTCAVHQADDGKPAAAEATKIKELFKTL